MKKFLIAALIIQICWTSSVCQAIPQGRDPVSGFSLGARKPSDPPDSDGDVFEIIAAGSLGATVAELRAAVGLLRGSLVNFFTTPANEISVASNADDANNQAAVLTGFDPFLSFEIEWTNPSDQESVLDFSLESDIQDLAFLVRYEGQTSLEVFDTGGDQGASASISQLLFTVDADGSTVLNDGFRSTSAADGQPAAAATPKQTQSTTGGIMGMATAMSLTLSPGDTAVVRGYYSLDDAAKDLIDPDLILDGLQAFIDSAAIPEPSSLVLIGFWSFTIAVRRCKEG